MSTGISPASPLASLSTSPRPAAPARTTRRAAAWVVALVWGLPLLGFTAAALLAPATGCDPALGGEVPCDAQGSVVVLGVLSLVLLVPLGLLSLLLVPVLGAALRWHPPAVVLALAATGCALAAGGVLILVANLVA